MIKLKIYSGRRFGYLAQKQVKLDNSEPKKHEG